MPDTYQSPLLGFLGGYQQGQDQQLKEAQQSAQEELQKQQAAFQKQSADLLQNRFDADQQQQEKDNAYRDKALQQTADITTQKLADANAKWQAVEAGKAQRQQFGATAKQMLDAGKGWRDVYKYMRGNGLSEADAAQEATRAHASMNVDRILQGKPQLELPHDLAQIMHDENPNGTATFLDPAIHAPQTPQVSPDLNPNATPNTVLPAGTNAPTPGMPAAASGLDVRALAPALFAGGAVQTAPPAAPAPAPSFTNAQGLPDPMGYMSQLVNAPAPADTSAPPVVPAGAPNILGNYAPPATTPLNTLGNPLQPSPGGLPPAPLQVTGDGRRADGTYPDLRQTLASPQDVAKAATGGATNGVLPLVQGKMDMTKSRIGLNDARTKQIIQKTEDDHKLLDPKLQNLLSLASDRDAHEKEVERHNGVMEKLGQANQAMNLRLKSAQIDNLSARTAKTKATPTKDVLDNRRYIAQDKAQAVGMFRDAKTERDKLVMEATTLNAAIQQRPPDRGSYINKTTGQPDPAAYAQAQRRYEQVQSVGKARLLELVGPDGSAGRVGELDGQLENLDATIQKQRNALGVGMTDSSGRPVTLTGPNLNNQTHPAPPNPANNPQFSSVGQVGPTPNVMFRNNDRGQVNPNALDYLQRRAQSMGMQIEVGTAVANHSHNVIIHGQDTGRVSDHANGNGFDVTRIKGPDGIWHTANVNDPIGAQMARQLGQAVAGDGHQAIFGVDTAQTGNHMDHLHVGYKANGGGTSFIGNGSPAPQRAAAPARPAQPTTTRTAATPAPARTATAPARPGGRTDYSKMSDADLKRALAQRLLGNH